jgi:hypothetical protein
MSFLKSSSERILKKTAWGVSAILTYANHHEWNHDMIVILSVMKAYAILTGDDPEPQHIDFDHDGNYDHWKAKEADTVSMMSLSSSPEVRRTINGMRIPHDMWNPPEATLRSGTHYMSRQDILHQSCAC